MPNTARGGGISRKITSAQDRSRLKEVVQDLDVPEGMGIILRTAGAARTKPEIKRDFEYLIRMWETVRDTTLKSQAPTLVYEEGSLIKRSLRDLYNKEIDEILVAGEAGYQEARDFMKMLMPASVRAVKQYRDGQPLFSRMGVESQLDAMFSPTVQLRSGGYIVINQTEALVSIDVNSGRATREHHIEDTALKTNLEASEEVARQLRLRDLAGLIVIDFIDMDEKRNNRAVERKLSDCLRQDRARIQVGRISHFGLLEMSRQRIRASVLESSTEPCPQCGGTGHVRSVSSVALQLLRGIEEILMKGATHNLVVRTRNDVALYVLNHKRGHLRDLENAFKVTLAVVSDANVSGVQSYIIDRGEQVHTLEAAKALLAAQVSIVPAQAEEALDEEEPLDAEFESEVETEESEGLGEEFAAGEAGEGESEQDGQGRGRKRRRRRRGRGGEPREREAGQPREEGETVFGEASPSLEGPGEEGDSEEDEGEEQPNFARGDNAANGERRPRRRGRRGGRRRRGNGERPEDGLAGSITDELSPPPAPEAADAVADFDGGHPPAPSLPEVQPEPIAPAHEPSFAERPAQVSQPAPEPEAHEDEKPVLRRSTVREKVSFGSSAPAADTPAPAVHSAPRRLAFTATLHKSGSVSVRNVPSSLYRRSVRVAVPKWGEVTGDIAWGGNWFFLVGDHEQELTIDRVETLTEFTWAIRQVLTANGVTGNNGAEIDHVELFAPSPTPGVNSRNFVLCPGKAYDRSPCGTGTSAKLACLFAEGRLREGEIWRQESITGSVFEGTVRVGPEDTFIPTITGTAFVNAEATLILDPADPPAGEFADEFEADPYSNTLNDIIKNEPTNAYF